MRSVRSQLENKGQNSAYRKNQTRSIGFLMLLAVLLFASALLSLRAGSYNTPVGELIKGVFGLSADGKINLVVQNNRLPRICTAILAGAGLGLSGCILQAILHNPWLPHPLWAYPREPRSAPPWPLLSCIWAAAWGSLCSRLPALSRWR